MLKLIAQPIRRATFLAILKSFHLSSGVYSCRLTKAGGICGSLDSRLRGNDGERGRE